MNILNYTLEKYLNGECELLDAHCHMKQTEEFKLICNGLLPSGYEFDKQGESSDIYIGLGYHPWGVQQASSDEMEIFEKHLSDTKFIGEIGLDFGEKHISSKNEQIQIFNQICNLLGNCRDKVLSIHAVKSASKVMDVLEKTNAQKNNIVVMHWFSGNSDELKRALDSGYYFSVGPKMLATNKGREYISQIPENKIFFETDLPWDGEEVSAIEHLNLLNDFAMQIRELK